MSAPAPAAVRIEARIARLHALYPRLIDLSLDRLRRLLDRLGNPEAGLPPVIHVAGTNGKGSTCAFLRAMAEAGGWRAHVYTSPHLVRFNERFRVAGRLVDDAALEATLAEIETVNAGDPITVFEVLTACAFLLFARRPAELCILEVGLGGRGDATNVIARPAATAVTSISLDHRELLGETLAEIAAEKAGIFKPGVPAAFGTEAAEVTAVLRARAAAAGAPPWRRGHEWDLTGGRYTRPPSEAGYRHGLARAATPTLRAGYPDSFGTWVYHDRQGSIALPEPALPGPHQWANAALAVAALRASGLALPPEALADGVARAEWPARLQRLDASLLPAGFSLWLDGGHNPGAGLALAAQLDRWADQPVHLIVGMKQGKDAADFLRPLLTRAATVWAVAEPGQHLALPVTDIIAAAGGRARPGPTVAAALAALRREAPGRVLICGSLYLAGEVLKSGLATAPA